MPKKAQKRSRPAPARERDDELAAEDAPPQESMSQPLGVGGPRKKQALKKRSGICFCLFVREHTMQYSTPTCRSDVKDPVEAAQYLVVWDTREDGGWRFNKSTQSWLIRHMYERDKVNHLERMLLLRACDSLPILLCDSRFDSGFIPANFVLFSFS